jgi:predicted metal-dependent phosphoesterase TrpH
MTPDQVIAACVRRGITCLAVTDHNEIFGALEVARLAPFRVIVGEEVRTDAGEIIGYFLSERIPRGLSPAETVRRIRDQGGVVCVPHPFDRLRGSRLRYESLLAVLPDLDALEVANARAHLLSAWREASQFAAEHGLAATAGSDAHTSAEGGGAWVEMPDFADARGFVESLRQGTIHGRPASPLVHVLSLLSRARRHHGG